MANSWFTPSGDPAVRSGGSSALIRAALAAIGAAFDRLPAPLAGGTQGFTGGVFQGPTINIPSIQGGSIGSGANPVVASVSAIRIGAGTGFAAGDLPVETGTLGAFFRMAGTNRVGYARSNTGTPVTSFFFDDARGLVMGDGANEIATSATAGFLYIPTCNGTPTGAPTAYTGAVPIVFDRSARKLWVRSAGTWYQTSALT
jgi:hypothetical protein